MGVETFPFFQLLNQFLLFLYKSADRVCLFAPRIPIWNYSLNWGPMSTFSNVNLTNLEKSYVFVINGDRLLKLKKNFSFIYSSIKCRICKMFDTISQVAFALILGPHNDRQIYTDR